MDDVRINDGLKKYCSIMTELYQTDVAQDKAFQRMFNGFYRMRQRPKDFYSVYFSFLEENKMNKDLTFEEVLTYLFRETGEVHASFSSKLLATVRPEMPIWDKFVLQNLGLRPTYGYEANRLEKTVVLYQKICDWYHTEDAAKKLEEFNAVFPEAEISDVKKIDFILWATR